MRVRCIHDIFINKNILISEFNTVFNAFMQWPQINILTIYFNNLFKLNSILEQSRDFFSYLLSIWQRVDHANLFIRPKAFGRLRPVSSLLVSHNRKTCSRQSTNDLSSFQIFKKPVSVYRKLVVWWSNWHYQPFVKLELV